MPKNIVIFSDGTGQDGGVRPEQRVSNVYKMYRVCKNGPESGVDPNDQVAFYDPGLGTDIGATALTAPVCFVQKMAASMSGRGITTNIIDCYRFILDHYREGDRIFLIGFSRGAYTVRCIANLLRLCGVPTKGAEGDLLRFRKMSRDIAVEAVETVFEHGAGHKRETFEDERETTGKARNHAFDCHDLDAEFASARCCQLASAMARRPWITTVRRSTTMRINSLPVDRYSSAEQVKKPSRLGMPVINCPALSPQQDVQPPITPMVSYRSRAEDLQSVSGSRAFLQRSL